MEKRIFVKQQLNLRFIPLLMAALLIMICAPFLISCSNGSNPSNNINQFIGSGEPEIEHMVLCRSVDEDFAPIDATDVFPADTNSIYLSVKFKNLTDNNTLKVTWNYSVTNQGFATQVFIPEQAGSGYYSFNIKIATSFPPGNYNAVVYFDNKQIESLDFKVE